MRRSRTHSRGEESVSLLNKLSLCATFFFLIYSVFTCFQFALLVKQILQVVSVKNQVEILEKFVMQMMGVIQLEFVLMVSYNLLYLIVFSSIGALEMAMSVGLSVCRSVRVI